MKQNSLHQLASRRRFLTTVAACTTTLSASKLARAISPNDKLRLAFIGVGGRGAGNLEEMIKDPGVEVAAICDVNRTTLDRVSERFPKARKQVDLRRLVEDLKDIDAVVVSTTEHTTPLQLCLHYSSVNQSIAKSHSHITSKKPSESCRKQPWPMSQRKWVLRFMQHPITVVWSN